MSQVLLTGQLGAPWDVMTLTDDADQLQSGTYRIQVATT